MEYKAQDFINEMIETVIREIKEKQPYNDHSYIQNKAEHVMNRLARKLTKDLLKDFEECF